MSAFGTSLLRAPKGLSNTVGRCPTPHVRHVAGVQGKTSCTLTQSVVASNPKAGRYAVASQALTGFQLRPLRLVLLPHGDGEGSRATKSCILPLTP